MNSVIVLMLLGSVPFINGALQRSWDLSGTQAAWGTLITTYHNNNRTYEGKSIPNLAWDASLSKIAQAWANKCIFTHSSNGYGENLAANSVYSIAATPVPRSATDAEAQNGLKMAVTNWMSEKAYYTYSTNTCNPPAGKACGHYTQVIWKNTTKVGCGIAQCDTGILSGWSALFIVCNYSPPGNYVGQKPY